MDVKNQGWFGKIVGNRYLVLPCRLVLGVIFLLSAIGKLVDLQGSVDAVYGFNIFPLVFARFAGLTVPFIELLMGLGLLLGILTRLAAFGASLLSLAFFLVKVHVLFVQGREIDCGCFGALMSTMASVTIYMDIPMLFMGLLIMAAPDPSRCWVSIAGWVPQRWREKLHFFW